MQIRKCERVIVYNATEVANLNPEDFKTISIPFEGESDEEFLSYLDENKWNLEEIWEEFSEETLSELNKLLGIDYGPDWTEYSNSAYKGEDSWLEVGEVNEEFTKTGGFDARYTTAY